MNFETVANQCLQELESGGSPGRPRKAFTFLSAGIFVLKTMPMAAFRYVKGKTVNAARYVDLASPIAAIMNRVVGDTKPGVRILRTRLTTLCEHLRVAGFHSL